MRRGVKKSLDWRYGGGEVETGGGGIKRGVGGEEQREKRVLNTEKNDDLR